eukprot:scaffold1600_cov179-Amphora_coffeaeformis.AAC.24
MIERTRRDILRRSEMPYGRILFAFEGTCLRGLSRDWLLWLTMSIFLIVRAEDWFLGALPSFAKQVSRLNIDVIGGFLSFFLVLFVNQSNARFQEMYKESMTMVKRIHDISSIVRHALPNAQAKRMVRYMNAAHAAAYVGLNDTYTSLEGRNGGRHALAIFVIGLRMLGRKMIDPYGSDLEDLSVLHYIQIAWDRSHGVFTTKFPANVSPELEDELSDKAVKYSSEKYAKKMNSPKVEQGWNAIDFPGRSKFDPGRRKFRFSFSSIVPFRLSVCVIHVIKSSLLQLHYITKESTTLYPKRLWSKDFGGRRAKLTRTETIESYDTPAACCCAFDSSNPHEHPSADDFTLPYCDNE